MWSQIKGINFGGKISFITIIAHTGGQFTQIFGSFFDEKEEKSAKTQLGFKKKKKKEKM